jgi:hypothetical protein
MANQPLTYFATKHLLAVARAVPSWSTLVPGGIYKGVGPDNIPYPFMVFSYVSGSDTLNLNTDPVALSGGGLLYQIKAVDRATTDEKAVGAYSALSAALRAANGSSVSGARVVGQEEGPFDLPVTEKDQLFQQIGGLWRFWIDPLS